MHETGMIAATSTPGPGYELRVAEALDHSHRQRVTSLHTSFQRGAVALQVDAHGDAAEDLRDATRSAELFEKEFHVKLYFRQSMA